MSKFPPKITCAGCGIEKGEANHWHLISAYISSVFAPTAENPAHAAANRKERRTLEINEFDLQLAEEKNQHPVCGNSCVQKLVERWLSGAPLSQEK